MGGDGVGDPVGKDLTTLDLDSLSREELERLVIELRKRASISSSASCESGMCVAPVSTDAPEESDFVPLPKDLLRQMLVLENEMRLSEETQKAFAEAETDHSGKSWIDVTDQLQRRVCRHFGVEEEYGLINIRAAISIYPDEPSFREIPLYVKYNRCKQGPLRCGDEVPNVTLLTTAGVPTTLSEFYGQGKPLVLFGGSYS